MNTKNNNGGFFDKFKKIIGLSASESNNQIKNSGTSFPKSKPDEKKINSASEEKKNNANSNPSKGDKKDLKNDKQDNKSDVNQEAKNVNNISKNKDEEKNDSVFTDEKSDSLTEKFKKKGIGPKKSLKEIADEAQKKKEETEGKAFAEGDAAKKDLKKIEEGFEKTTKHQGKIKKALQGKVFLVRGKDNGRPAWHYVLVSKDKEAELRKQKAGTNIDVADYGKIIKSGWGEEPSDEVKKQIDEEYGS